MKVKELMSVFDRPVKVILRTQKNNKRIICGETWTDEEEMYFNDWEVVKLNFNFDYQDTAIDLDIKEIKDED